MHDGPGARDEYATTAEMYDHVVPYRDRADIGFWVDRARSAGGRVLEMGCGTGRVLIPIAQAGVPITGLDSSPAMLACCRRKLAAVLPGVDESRVRLVEGDMRRFDLDDRFALVIAPFRSFQHLLDPPDQLACLACVSKHLRPGGQLILDFFNPDVRRLAVETFPGEWIDEPAFAMPDGRTIQRRIRVLGYDRARQVMDFEMTYEEVSGDHRTPIGADRLTVRYFFRYEVEHLLARAGFDVVEVLGDYDGTPFGTRYPGDLIAVARQP